MATRPKPAPAPDPDELWTMADVSKRLKCSDDTVHRMIARGELRAIRVGKRLLRVDPADVATLLKPTPTVPASWEKRINELVSAAPTLTPAQADRIAGLLRGGGVR